MASFNAYQSTVQCAHDLFPLQEGLDVRVWITGNHATASLQWKSTTRMEITGGMDLVFHVHNSHCAPILLMQEWWGARFMCVDITKEQVNKENNIQ